MNRKLKHLLGEKRGIYRLIKMEEANFFVQYVNIKREVKKEIGNAKFDYEIQVANESKINEGIGPLRTTS